MDEREVCDPVEELEESARPDELEADPVDDGIVALG